MVGRIYLLYECIIRWTCFWIVADLHVGGKYFVRDASTSMRCHCGVKTVGDAIVVLRRLERVIVGICEEISYYFETSWNVYMLDSDSLGEPEFLPGRLV